MIQAHLFYSGAVQGVGFRYTVQQLADDLTLKGWVRNLPDGRVEILVEGPRDAIGQLCRNIEVHFEGYIKNKEIDFNEASCKFKNFQIAF